MAAGLTVEESKIETAMSRLNELLEKQGAHNRSAADLRVDGVLMPQATSVEMVELIEQTGPFGAQASAPRYVFANMKIRFAKRVGENHLKVSFGDGTDTLEAICFGAYDGAIGPALESHGGAAFHLVGRLEINTWRGRRSVQLRIEDAARA